MSLFDSDKKEIKHITERLLRSITINEIYCDLKGGAYKIENVHKAIDGIMSSEVNPTARYWMQNSRRWRVRPNV